MMPPRLLFLLGGSAAYDAVAEEFVPAAGERDATIVLLMQGGHGWEKYVPEYVQPWIRRGVSRYYPIAPDENGTLDLGAVSATLREATGIFIGGGHTPTYHRLYATEPIRGIIRESYRKGLPIAGVSAGALIAPEICVLPPDETDDGLLQIVDGLGLVSDILVGVHFSERNALSSVLEAMARTETRTGWGIDEPACVVFEHGHFKRALGRSVYEIVMTDFETRAYRMTEWPGKKEPNCWKDWRLTRPSCRLVRQDRKGESDETQSYSQILVDGSAGRHQPAASAFPTGPGADSDHHHLDPSG